MEEERQNALEVEEEKAQTTEKSPEEESRRTVVWKGGLPLEAKLYYPRPILD